MRCVNLQGTLFIAGVYFFMFKYLVLTDNDYLGA